MQELKFRAWDKADKVMLPPVKAFDFGVDESGLYWHGSHYESWSNDRDESDLILMQYTGLRDKNSVDIYCSDIVRGFFNPDDVEDHVWLSLTEEELKNGTKLFVIPENIIDFAREFYPDELIVLGNIYENNELLGE